MQSRQQGWTTWAELSPLRLCQARNCSPNLVAYGEAINQGNDATASWGTQPRRKGGAPAHTIWQPSPGTSGFSPSDSQSSHSQLCSTGKSFHMGEMGKRKVPHSQLTFLTSFWAAFQDTRETCTCIARPKVSTINVLMREK